MHFRKSVPPPESLLLSSSSLDVAAASAANRVLRRMESITRYNNYRHQEIYVATEGIVSLSRSVSTFLRANRVELAQFGVFLFRSVINKKGERGRRNCSGPVACIKHIPEVFRSCALLCRGRVALLSLVTQSSAGGVEHDDGAPVGP